MPNPFLSNKEVSTQLQHEIQSKKRRGGGKDKVTEDGGGAHGKGGNIMMQWS